MSKSAEELYRDSLKLYKETVELSDSLQDSEPFKNKNEDHAKILLSQIIKKAKVSVNIISSTLSLYDDTEIIDSLRSAIDNGAKIKILLDGEKDKINLHNKFLTLCKESESCEVRITPNKLKAHITTRDGLAHRYCNDFTQHKAIANFNDPHLVEIAETQVFGDYYSQQPAF
ncbi:phospholipase D-like domain-containing protein [Bathymodiolus thermophilus thioautotrophic gill symbiont]|uniref:Phospholipase D-like domain-containing protein n=1 Tax=Bathymodiolus thermophilus thioautotrophic gill symbiont TaxID=2360 RepID=A0A1J5TWJ8_9GAMM|nr:phospholipase D-like domain-containing protein [Bathymodiolus thermophilus thioautotrophic gill symbiont]OIR25130.1 hypothetical protein BGC33_12780 [Bathymodiolus thermophilus thioautotrophic gill symbiont]